MNEIESVSVTKWAVPETKQGPVGLPGMEAFFFLSPITYRQIPAFMTFLASKGQIWTIANQVRISQVTTWDKIKETREAHQD